MNRRIGNFFDQALEMLGRFSDAVDALARAPVDAQHDAADAGIFKRVLMMPLRLAAAVVALVFKALLLPFQLMALVTEGSWRESALCLPAIGVAALAGFAFFRVHFFGGDIVHRYRMAANAAMGQQDWELAKVYLGRIVNAPDHVGDADRLRWAMALQRTGSSAQADQVMDALAPEDRPGSPLGHRIKAISLANGISQTKRPDAISRLHWHLKNAGKPQQWELNQAWAMYYLALEQTETAIEYLKAAAEFEPKFWLQIAELHRQQGDDQAHQRAARQAVSIFEARVTQEPANSQSRVAWANALFRAGDVDRAQEVLQQGLKLYSNRFLRHAMADFYLMRHDQAVVDDPEDFGQQFELLKQAIELDLNYVQTYQRLIEQFTADRSAQHRDQIRELLEGMITDGTMTGFGHFALANVLWLSDQQEDGRGQSSEDLRDEAQWHMEQAYQMESALVVVANNLAWFLAHREDPDLDRALTLAEDAVSRSDDPRFRDTLGRVLLKQGKYDQALVELKKALERIKNKGPVHEKLALVYERLGKPRLAALHREKASDLNVKN